MLSKHVEDSYSNCTEEEPLSDYSEQSFDSYEKQEYWDYREERKMMKEEGYLNETESDSSGSEMKIPKTARILKYIFRGAVEKTKYEYKDWYGKKTVAREIQAFANRKYKLNGQNQNERRKRLTSELKNLKQLAEKPVQLKELEGCFERIDEIKLR